MLADTDGVLLKKICKKRAYVREAASLVAKTAMTILSLFRP